MTATRTRFSSSRLPKKPNSLRKIKLPETLSLSTERLILSYPVVSDSVPVSRLLNDATVSKYLRNISVPFTTKDSLDLIKASIAQIETSSALNVVVRDRQRKTPLGFLQLRFDPETFSGELSYWFGSLYWGNGFATEAGKSLLDYAFSNAWLHRVYAKTAAKNLASIRVLLKLRFSKCGVARQAVVLDRVFQDVEYYDLLSDEHSLT